MALFGKNEAKPDSDIDALKKRFAQLQQQTSAAQPASAKTAAAPAKVPAPPPPQQQTIPSAPPLYSPAPPLPPVMNAAPITPPAAPAAPSLYAPAPPLPPVRPAPAQPVSPTLGQPFLAPAPNPLQGRSPLEALAGLQSPPSSAPVRVVEVEGHQGTIVNQAFIQPGQQETASALPPGGTSAEEKSVIEESLEALKEEYDDAKLNSVIIEQVKELIEIDTNLNSKIDDLRLDLKREVEERNKLVKKVDDNYKELKEIEKSIDKFIALYELVTNQFNPFVKQDDPETRQKMQALFQDAQQRPQASPAPIPQPPASYTIPQPAAASPREADSPFIARNGASITNLPALIHFLESCSPEEFSHHVTPDRNDFAAWLQYALRAPAVAAFIQPLKTKEQIVAALRTVR